MEGEAGFYHAYAGNSRGELRYSFTGSNRTDMAAITQGLGRDWIFLETLYRIYSTAGYNIAHIDVTAALCAEHDIRHQDIERIEALVNWFETEYPSPAFPSRGIESPPQIGSTQYFTAYGAVERGYPLLRGDRPGPGESDPPAVLDLMRRVTLIPTVRRTLFGPRITVFLKDGRSFTKEGTGREFIWDFEEEARRINPIAPGLAIARSAIRRADRHLPPPRPHRARRRKADRADHSSRPIKTAQSEEHRLYAQRRTCLAKPLVERTQRRALFGADGEMQGISGAHAQRILIRKPRGHAKLCPRYRQDSDTAVAQTGEHRQGLGPVTDLDLPGPQFDRKSRGEFGRYPVADRETSGTLIAEPILHAPGFRLVGQGCDEQRGVEINHQ